MEHYLDLQNKESFMFAEDRNSRPPCDCDESTGPELELDEAVILVRHYLEIQRGFYNAGLGGRTEFQAGERIADLVKAGAIPLARVHELSREVFKSTSEDTEEAPSGESVEAGRHESKLEQRIRAAILKSRGAPYQIARKAGVRLESLLQFLNEKRGMTLAIAGRICAVLGLSVSHPAYSRKLPNRA